MITVELTNNMGKLKGLSPELMDTVRSHCSYWVDGAEHDIRFKKKQWDGMKHFVHKSHGTFPMGLWDTIRPIIDKFPHEILDKRQGTRSKIQVETNDLVEGRDYQMEAVKTAIMNPRSVLQVATGGGKTVIASILISMLKCNTLFLVHTKDLLYQTKKSFEEMLESGPIGQIGDGVIDIQPITVATIQSIAKYLNIKVTSNSYDDADTKEKSTTGKAAEVKKFLDSVDLLIWDEVHRVACDMAYDVSKAIDNAYYRTGLSASPWRDDGADIMINAAIGPVTYKLDASTLIKLGFLVPPIIRRIPIKPSIEWYVDPRTYDQIYRDEIVNNKHRNELIVKYVEQFAEMGIPTLVLVQQIKHGKMLKKMISERFDPIDFLSGRDLSHVRVGTIQEMRDGKRHNLIASTIADEGLDIKRLTGLILAGGGKSSTRALQRIGRVVRPFEGKTHAVVIDFDDQAKYMIDHSEKRKKIFQSESEFIILETEE